MEKNTNDEYEYDYDYGLFVDLEESDKVTCNSEYNSKIINTKSNLKTNKYYYIYTIDKNIKKEKSESDFKNIKEKNKYFYKYSHFRLQKLNQDNYKNKYNYILIIFNNMVCYIYNKLKNTLFKYFY